MIFSGMLEPREIQQKWFFYFVFPADPLSRSLFSTRKESFMVQPIMDHLDLRCWNAEKSLDVPRRILTDSDNFILRPGKLFHHHPAIDHPCEIIFLRYMERRQVVD